MNKLEKLHLEVIEESKDLVDYDTSGYTWVVQDNKAAIESAEITELIAVNFATFISNNCNAFLDGWHYKGNVYTTRGLFKEFLEQTL